MAKKKPYFDPVEPRVDFPELEKRLLADWYKKGIVKKYLNKNKSAKKYFSFLDGPITANNPMGVHHAWGRTYKDLWQRFKNMQGYRQRFQNGFDCQGLWVEVEVEKELGFKSKKDIEKYGVAKFVEKCRQRVLKYSAIQTEQTKRLGNFMDWDNSYYTMSDENNYTIWHFLKTCHENGWIYKGNDVVPWCPRCETAISQHEILTEDYKEVTHESVYFRLPLEGKVDEYLLVWTTTPWTIPANIAVAVDPKLEYIKVLAEDGKRYYLAKEALERVFGKVGVKIEETALGSKLVGLKYRAPFSHLPVIVGVKDHKLLHTVVATDSLLMPITTEEGTGMVHTSTGTGEEDHRLGKKIGLPVVAAIDDRANYLEGYGELTGKNAKEEPHLVLDFLEANDYVFRTQKYKHRYPACWRCKTELVWKVTDEWYIAMDKGTPSLRERMVAVAKKIKWIPGFGLERELDWLTNMHDWLISKKNRYWGLALPIWECGACGEFEVIGSKEELKERAVAGWEKFEGKSPHKPYIDEVVISCRKCGAKANRIEPVGNPWLDAGIVTFSTMSDDNRAATLTGKIRPPYLVKRSEWEKWYPADFITESFPGQFKNWFYSLIAMSTALEDKGPFKSVLGFASLLAEDGRPMHKSWGNAIEFNEGADKIGVDVMRWMYSRQNPTENLLFGYRLADETRRKFHLKLWNVYNYFVTYANVNGWKPARRGKSGDILDRWILARLGQVTGQVTAALEKYDAYAASGSLEEFVDDLSNWYIRRSRGRGDKDFFATTYEVLTTICKLLAPFTPFIAETIYQNLTKEESVHLVAWPAYAKATGGQTEIVKEMKVVREIVERGHGLRKEKKIAVRQPLASLMTKHFQLKDYFGLMEDELNVKAVVRGSSLAELDTKITPELRAEGEARELVRKIQEERKRLGTALDEKVVVYLPSWPEAFAEEIKRRAGVSKVEKGEFKVVRRD